MTNSKLYTFKYGEFLRPVSNIKIGSVSGWLTTIGIPFTVKNLK